MGAQGGGGNPHVLKISKIVASPQPLTTEQEQEERCNKVA